MLSVLKYKELYCIITNNLKILEFFSEQNISRDKTLFTPIFKEI